MELRPRPTTLRDARALRGSMSRAEVALWQAVRASRLGYKIRRQHPFGPYILDFYCAAAKLCIEVDGPLHDAEHRQAADHARDQYLIRHGIRTLRIPAAVVMNDLDGVLVKLTRWIERCVQTADNHH